MHACRSFDLLRRCPATIALLCGALFVGACSPEAPASVGGGDSSPDLAVGEPPAPDLAAPQEEPAPDLAGAPNLTPDLSAAKVTSPPDLATTVPAPRDITFYVVADTHADPPTDSYDLRATARVINAVAQNGQWPSSIDGTATGFVGGKIAPPRGVVLVGDLTGWGTAPTEIQTFRHYFEQGNSADSIQYPAYLGLGNHDIDTADRTQTVADDYRAQYWAWVTARHSGPSAPVPAGSYDAASHAYSWDFAGVHFVQTNRFPGDQQYGLSSALPFLKADLASHANDGRPVFVFHHYGMDAFGTQARWWTDADRAAYRDALRGYNVAGIFTGHTHFAMQYTWESLRVFQANNAKAEINTGNNDGNGSFAIVRITDSQLDVVTCRWLDDQGHYELIAPFYSGVANPGPALRPVPPPARRLIGG
jgi:cytolysin (calcineurin-like family phosphatase)